jgi:hypothetical protein
VNCPPLAQTNWAVHHQFGRLCRTLANHVKRLGRELRFERVRRGVSRSELPGARRATAPKATGATGSLAAEREPRRLRLFRPVRLRSERRVLSRGEVVWRVIRA